MNILTVYSAVLLSLFLLNNEVYSQGNQPLPNVILGGIGNVASTATNFLSGVVREQTEMLHRVTDTATNFINSAVENPKDLLINATRATTGLIESAASRGLEFKLRRFLEKFRTRMRYGIQELGIPALEPLQLEQIEIHVDNSEIGKLELQLNELELNNLSTFIINKAKLSLIGPTITANLTIPKIYAVGYYNISGILADKFPLYGNGQFQANLYGLSIYVNTVLGYSRGMYIKSFDLDFTLAQMAMDLENFMGGDDIGRVMSQVFQDLTPKALEIIKPDILPTIQSYIAGQVNETIHHLTMRDVLHVLLGPIDLREYAHLLTP